MRRLFTTIALCLIGWVAGASAQSAVDTCLTVEGFGAESDAFQRLLRSELDRHPSHRLSEASCSSQLAIERIQLSGTTYLTGRLSGQVPHRVRVQGARLNRALAELLRVVLGNDPLVLRDPSKSDWFGRAMFGLRHRAHPLWGGSVAQRLAFVQGEVFALPELSLHYRRELEHWQAGIRIDVAGNLEPRLRLDDPRTQPRWLASVLPELSWFSSGTANTAFYASAALGLSHQRFDAQKPDSQRRGPASKTGVLLALRTGLEVLRTTDTRLGLFAEVALPAFIGKRAEGGQGWVPSIAAGVGLGF